MFGSKDTVKLEEKNDNSSFSSLSNIAKGIKFSGDISGAGDVCIDGSFDGNITCGKLTIGITGKITGIINATQLIIFGSFDGKATAESVQLMDSAIVTGDIFHDILEIAAGAKIDGRYSKNIKKATNVNIKQNKTISDKGNMVSLKPVENNKNIKLKTSNTAK